MRLINQRNCLRVVTKDLGDIGIALGIIAADYSIFPGVNTEKKPSLWREFIKHQLRLNVGSSINIESASLIHDINKIINDVSMKVYFEVSPFSEVNDRAIALRKVYLTRPGMYIGTSVVNAENGFISYLNLIQSWNS